MTLAGHEIDMVDVPGFGFVLQKIRQEWSDLLEEYLTNRSNLKVVFHLVDARHGTTS